MFLIEEKYINILRFGKETTVVNICSFEELYVLESYIYCYDVNKKNIV